MQGLLCTLIKSEARFAVEAAEGARVKAGGDSNCASRGGSRNMMTGTSNNKMSGRNNNFFKASAVLFV